MSDEQVRTKEDGVDEVLAKWRGYISARPPLTSVLYDIDMLPEQCVTLAGAIRLAAFCVVWKAWEEGGQYPDAIFTQEAPA